MVLRCSHLKLCVRCRRAGRGRQALLRDQKGEAGQGPGGGAKPLLRETELLFYPLGDDREMDGPKRVFLKVRSQGHCP